MSSDDLWINPNPKDHPNLKQGGPGTLTTYFLIVTRHPHPVSASPVRSVVNSPDYAWQHRPTIAGKHAGGI